MEEIDTETNELHQYLTFGLGDEFFALEIAKVHEVMDVSHITKVPRMPRFMRGVINLRGNVVPVVDLRMVLGMEEAQTTVDSCIIIAEVILEGEGIQLGALADSVSEVAEIDPSEIQAPSRLGTRVNTEFIKGMGRRNDDFVIILDIDKVLNKTDMGYVQGVTEKESVKIDLQA
jgi:purine-binding chemotaxis protein CheW